MRRNITACALIALAGTSIVDHAQGEPERTRDLTRQERQALGERAERLQSAALVDIHNSSLRLEAAGAVREAVLAGAMHPFDVLLPGVLEEATGAPVARSVSALSGGALARARAVNPHPWAGQIAFAETFEHEEYTRHISLAALADLRPIAGQVAPNGEVWRTSTTRSYNGLLTNSTAQTGIDTPGGLPGSGYKGVAGGPDPLGVQGTFLGHPRGSVQSLTSAAFDTSFQWIARLSHDLFLPTPDEPMTVVYDVYMDTLETFTWYRPVGTLVTTSFIMGGLDFFTFAPFTNDDNVLDRPIVLGLRPGSTSSTEFFASAHRLKAREWFQVGFRQGVDSYSFWMRDSETRGANASGMPFDAPGYEGDIFDTEWVQLFPGFADDPSTPAIEGSGIAKNTFGLAPDVYVNLDGDRASLPFYSYGVGQLALVGGFDMPRIYAPTYEPTDVYFDNYSVIGRPWEWAYRNPTPQLPFIDDMELRPPGPIAYSNGWRDYYAYGGVTESANHTLHSDHTSAPTRAGVMANLFGHGVYQNAFLYRWSDEDRLAARATTEKDLSLSMWLRLDAPGTSYGVTVGNLAGEWTTVFVGLRDAYGYADTRLGVEVAQANYDPDASEADTLSRNEAWDGVMNRRTHPAPLTLAGGSAPATAPIGEWFELEFRIDLDPGDTMGDLRVFLDGTELAIDSAFYVGLGSEVPSLQDMAPTLIDEMQVDSGYEVYGLGNRLWIDDLRLDGAPPALADSTNTDEAPFTTHPPFTVPYLDTMDSWDRTVPASGQGATSFLGYEGIGGYPGTAVMRSFSTPWKEGDPVDLFHVDEVIRGPGGAPAGLVGLETIAIPITYPPEEGSTTPDSLGFSEIAYFDNTGFVGSFIVTPISNSRQEWDGVTRIPGALVHQFQPRWERIGEASRFEDVESEHPGHGVALPIEAADRVRAVVPGPQTRPGQHATVSFDMFIGVAPESAPTRTTLTFYGAARYGSTHATIHFGGADYAYVIGEEIDDPTRLIAPVFDPATGSSETQDTGFSAPANTWFEVRFTVRRYDGWLLEIVSNEGDVLYSMTGETQQYGGAAPTIQSVVFERRTPAARVFEPITFASLGADAPPEAGLAPAGLGAYARPAKYFYYRILSIDESLTPDPETLPHLTMVDPATGETLSTSRIGTGSVVALANDTGTGSGSLTGIPLATSQPRNSEWRVLDSDGVTVLGGGLWAPTGAPWTDTYSSQIPKGGIVSETPPYNDGPAYQSLLMGTITNLPAYPALAPASRVLIDNLATDVTGCFMDLTGNGDVNGADLSMLLEVWGTNHPQFDANSDGTINGQDLAALLSNWGVCE